MNDILLVDDEPAVLQSLSAALDWSEYGFSQIHTANSAKEALSIMEKKPIDLIILDIQMPGMTGLEMLKKIRSRYPGTHCILISAYSKFEYAKEALQLNVENYLLKPVDIAELHETVTRAAENIRKAASSSHNLFERNLLDRWLHGRISNDELLEHSQYTHYNVLMRRYYAVIVRLAGRAAAVLHTLISSLPRDFAAYSLNTDSDTGVLLFGGHDISDVYIEEAAGSLVAAHPDILIICGSCAMGSNDVCKSFTDAASALEYARLAGYSGYISFDRINRHLLSPALAAQLNDMLQLTPSESRVHEFIYRITDENTEFQGDYQDLYARICLTMAELPEESDPNAPPLPPLSAPYTRENFERQLTDAILSVNSRQKCSRNYSPIIQRVMRYIQDNLGGSISIKHFCEQTNMNPTYIGRLFREELGMYFSEYVSNLRINRAKLLLESTSYSVSDIARQVGMYDVSYFVQCFRKKERISPMKYRQSAAQTKMPSHTPPL